MNILIVEPFFTGSHASWANGFAGHSRHQVNILKLGGNHWKWRMHGGAITLSRQFIEAGFSPDLIVATDMLDLTTFLALTRHLTAGIPTAVYLHENQLTYPWSPQDRDLKRERDKHYSFINVTSALAAQRVFFNSRYHRDSFLDELPNFLKQFPDHNELGQVDRIAAKSQVLPLGLDLLWFDEVRSPRPADGSGETHTGSVPVIPNARPLIVWNHRWEYDKNPEHFFRALAVLSQRGRSFDVALLGEVFDVTPQAFHQGISELADRVIHKGYVEDKTEYAKWLWRADVLPVTSNQDFFGGSVIEAVYCGCYPLLPRRLAYPELIPHDLHRFCFYADFADLVEKLDSAVTKIDRGPLVRFRHAVSGYDWRVMAPIYDRTFEDLLASQ
ncbi:MAG: DUF3524 domain-containing protein [Candidatus Krumholzibacteria bacterium]|nr:DUF3524 domain-containing protein [Candidatus Krumholzibacteria bacterium]